MALTVTSSYAYDSESITEKISGALSEASLETLVYLTILRNPNYVENDPNSGEWYIVKATEPNDA